MTRHFFILGNQSEWRANLSVQNQAHLTWLSPGRKEAPSTRLPYKSDLKQDASWPLWARSTEVGCLLGAVHAGTSRKVYPGFGRSHFSPHVSDIWQSALECMETKLQARDTSNQRQNQEPHSNHQTRAGTTIHGGTSRKRWQCLSWNPGSADLSVPRVTLSTICGLPRHFVGLDMIFAKVHQEVTSFCPRFSWRLFLVWFWCSKRAEPKSQERLHVISFSQVKCCHLEERVLHSSVEWMHCLLRPVSSLKQKAALQLDNHNSFVNLMPRICLWELSSALRWTSSKILFPDSIWTGANKFICQMLGFCGQICFTSETGTALVRTRWLSNIQIYAWQGIRCWKTDTFVVQQHQNVCLHCWQRERESPLFSHHLHKGPRLRTKRNLLSYGRPFVRLW